MIPIYYLSELDEATVATYSKEEENGSNTTDKKIGWKSFGIVYSLINIWDAIKVTSMSLVGALGGTILEKVLRWNKSIAIHIAKIEKKGLANFEPVCTRRNREGFPTAIQDDAILKVGGNTLYGTSSDKTMV